MKTSKQIYSSSYKKWLKEKKKFNPSIVKLESFAERIVLEWRRQERHYLEQLKNHKLV